MGSGKALRLTAPPVAGEVRGQVFSDRNRNGVRDPDEPPLVGWTVYLDLNRDGVRNPGEPSAVTDADGGYAFAGLAPGNHTVRSERQAGWLGSTPGSRVLEDFEDGLLRGYTAVGGTRGSAFAHPTAARDGSFGLRDNVGADVAFRNDPAAQVAQGDTVSVWLRFLGDFTDVAGGRAFFGFGATPITPGGTFLLVAAADTNELLLQQNLGTGAANVTLATVPQTYQIDRWYRLEATWGLDGTITARLYDSDGETLLSTATGAARPTATTAGGIAFQATGNIVNIKSWDTVTATRGDGTGRTLYLGPRQTVTGQDFAFHLNAVDNQDPLFVALGTGWQTAKGGYRGDYLFHAPGTGVNVAFWIFVQPPGTATELFVTWVARPENASNARYRISDGLTTLGEITVNQRTTPDDAFVDGTWWHSLGSYRSSTGVLIVTLSDDADGDVVADALFARAL